MGKSQETSSSNHVDEEIVGQNDFFNDNVVLLFSEGVKAAPRLAHPCSR